jgi:translation elongation factor EF-1beta
MKLREITLPYVLQEVDYTALRQAIKNAFVEEYGVGIVDNVRVAHFNPAIIDVTVMVQERQPTMDDFALALSEALRRQGVHVAIRITSDGIKIA